MGKDTFSILMAFKRLEDMLGKRILFVLMILVATFRLSAQEESSFEVSGRLTTDDGVTTGATITMTKNEKQESVTPLPRTGRFSFNLDFNNEYQLIFECEGYFKKIVEISTFVPSSVLAENDKFPPFQFVVNLFNDVPGVDESFTNKPVAKIYYNEKIDNFDSEIYFSDIDLEKLIEEAINQTLDLVAEQNSINKVNEQELAAREKEYDRMIGEGDALYQKQDFTSALANYKIANELFPDRPYPIDRIAELNDLIAAMQLNLEREREKETNYQAAIAEADRSFSQENYDVAAQAYKNALTFKENDSYAVDRLALSNQKIKEQEIDTKYNEAIKQADDYFAAKDYAQAKAGYENAITVKPGDSQYATDQLRKIASIQEEERLAKELEAENEKNYTAAIADADKSFKKEQYEDAIAAYSKALSYKDNDSYATDQLALSNQKIEEQKIAAQFNDLIKQADNYFKAKDYEQAKGYYENAIALRPDASQYAIEQVNKIESIFAEQEKLAQEQEAEKERKYTTAITEGDRLFNASELESAKNQYITASSIKPEEQYPKQQIDKVENEIARLAALNLAYNAALDEANKYANNKEYENAKVKYTDALQYRPDEEYPKLQILRMDEILAQIEKEKETNAAYEASINKADALLFQEEYASAKNEYQAASAIKPDEKYPATKIKEIDSILADLLKQQQENERIQNQYDDAIARADNAFDLKEYTTATATYKEAQTIKPEETYPQIRIDEIDRLLALQKEQAYQDAVAIADNFFTQEAYDDSKSSYLDALKIKANDTYASSQINLIDEKLRQLAAEEEARQKQESNYQTKLALAESAFNNEIYENAKEYYQQALEIKPNEQYPIDQIAKIDAILLEKQRQAEIDANYNQIITQANNAYTDNQLEDALGLYRNALDVKPDEALPKQRIADIEKMIARKEELARLAAEEEAQRIAVENANREKYNAAIEKAEAELKIENFANAKEYFGEALDILPDEQYPKNKIAEIDKLIEERALADMALKQQAYQDSLAKAQLDAYNQKIEYAMQHVANNQLEDAITAYREAIAILPEKEAEVTAIIDELQNQLRNIADLNSNYNRVILLADQYYTQSDWDNAISAYQNALSYKPNEEYPKERIDLIQGTLRNYTTAIDQADAFFRAEDWLNAKDKYSLALSIKKDEEYPSSQLIIVDRRIREEQEAILAGQEKEKSYQDAITKGDDYFTSEQLSASKTQYEFALNIKPGEDYPIRRIAEIDLLHAQKEQQEALAKQQKELDDRYRQAIALADNSYKGENYNLAKEQYQSALEIKPGETYPKSQIDKINDYLSSLAVPVFVVQTENQNTAIVNNIVNSSPSAALSNSYNDFIQQADDSFAKQDYAVAQFYYTKASIIDPVQSYPKERIAEISKLIDQMMSVADLSAYNEAIEKADLELAGKNYTIARFYYYKALEIKSWEQYPKDQLEEIRVLTKSLLTQREEEEYKSLIANADEAYFARNYSIARSYYNQALSIRPDEEYLTIKLTDIEKAIKSDLTDQKTKDYQQLVNQADLALTSKQYAIARAYYNQALNVKPGEQYPKDQIQKIKEALQNK